MKKILFLMSSLILFCSCNSCQNEKNEKNDDGVTPDSMVVENMISTDKQAMYLINKDYRWYETMILLNNYLDEENDGSIAEVVNVFQAIKDYDGKSFDTMVYKFQHFADGTCTVDSVLGFWIEDFALEDTVKIIPFKQAFELTNQVNLPKPHSRHVCLRNPIGPKGCNPQWVFGNVESQLWLDAINGTIKTSNPAFPEGFKYAFSW